MFAQTIQQFCEITGARYFGNLPSDTTFDRAVIDSRQAGPRSLFFALPGSQTHGIRFADAARTQGAIVVAGKEAVGEYDGSMIVAANPLRALQQLAQFNRRQSDALTIGITGSVGKTTTRRLLTFVLSTVYRGVQSPANYNNELGVPLSILQIEDDTEFAVIEMGARNPGDITELCRIAMPEFAVVTHIAPSHLSSFDSVSTIARTKQELIESMNTDGTALLNADDRHVLAMRDSAICRVITFGQSSDADQRYKIVDVSNTKLVIQMGGHEFCAQICGQHQSSSLAASIAVAQELGLSARDIQAGLDDFEPASGRTVLQKIDGIDVIDDTYNANPASVRAAILLLDQWTTQGRKTFVLGDMLDLGEQTAELHFAIGVVLSQTQINHAVAYGKHASDVADGFLSAGGALSRISVFDSEAVLLSILDCLIDHGDVLLVKGSRGMAMERIVEGLRRLPPNSLRGAA
ncbi:MAG: UDP-N-acetylmuramoyl-tripeptide--D-alanyl-D-alanine ligase [Fuerstiella sp.]|nr:UDP-N-acetylmuramoyl-tripeptide--D-alanyl-D-alanine ligase [Fuerstiella sp.]